MPEYRAWCENGDLVGHVEWATKRGGRTTLDFYGGGGHGMDTYNYSRPYSSGRQDDMRSAARAHCDELIRHELADALDRFGEYDPDDYWIEVVNVDGTDERLDGPTAP